MSDPVTTLEGISLQGLVIDNELAFSPVEAKVSRSLDGGTIVWEGNSSGRPIDMVGGQDFGWLERSVLKQVKTLAAIPNATYTLVHNFETFRVRFRHEESAPVSASPLVARPNHADTDYYNNVVIKLMEV